MIHILIGGAGCGKSTRLVEMIQQQNAAGETVLTLVPEQFSYEFDRKLYQTLGGSAFNHLQTYSFKSLARDVLRIYGNQTGEKTYADEMTRNALLYQAILYTSKQTHQLQILEKQCQQPSFVEEIAKLFAQFRRNGITADMIYQSCASLRGRLLQKTMDLYQIYQTYDRLLTEHHLKDAESDLTEAAAVANAQDVFLGDTLFVDEFEMFTKDEYDMLAVLLGACKNVFIALRTEETEDVPYSLFESVNHTLHRLEEMAKKLRIPVQIERFETPYRFQSPDLTWLSKHVFRPFATTDLPMENIHILEATDITEEADYVCTTIRRILAENPSIRCRDIAILTNQLKDYQSILEISMERYDLPYHMDVKQSVDYLPLMVYLYTLLELLRRKRPDTELLLRLGKTGLTACSDAEVSRLENYSYTRQIEGNSWLEPFSGGDSGKIEPLRQKLLLPILELKELCAGVQNGSAYCKILFEFVEKQKIQEHLDAQLHEIVDPEQRTLTTEEWAFAWNNWIEILEHIASLYQDVEIELREFCTIFVAMLRNVKRAIPPKTLDAVMISTGDITRLNAPKIVFLMGLCEGTFPAAPGGSTIFSEKDCMTLEALHLPVVESKEVQLADARLSAYVQLSAASQQLYLLYPSMDAAQQKCYPSAVITQIIRMFPQETRHKQYCAQMGTAYYATTLQAAYYQYVRNYDVDEPDVKSMAQILARDAFYREKLDALSKIAVHEMDRESDAPLFEVEDSALIKRYIGSTLHMSSSSLERYQKCPFTYYCKDMLHLQSRKKKQLNRTENGNLIHACLEQILRDYSKEAFIKLSLEELQQEIAHYADEYWRTEMGGEFSKSNRERAIYQHAVDGTLQLLLHMQKEFRQSSFEPQYLELEISPNNPDFPPLKLTTEQGNKIMLTGKVDRVDLCQEDDQKWVRVVDYKTGSKKFHIGNLLYGLDLQMLLYLFTITEPGAALSDCELAGVLYMPSTTVPKKVDRSKGTPPEKQWQETYRMNGILRDDPHLVTLMEQDGKGTFIEGKLKNSLQIDEKSGIFLTKEAMQRLRTFVMEMFCNTADSIYSGNIDAQPLILGKQDNCAHCDYANICGNSNHMRARCVDEPEREREAIILELLNADEKSEEKEDASNGMDTSTGTSDCN